MPHWTEEMFVGRPALFGELLENRSTEGPDQVDALLALLDATDGHDPGSVLDVACGIGRHLVPFAEAGLDVRGVDISPEYLDRARERVAAAGVAERVTLTEGDMRDLGDLDGRYDLVTSFWTSVGYFDEAGNRATFRGMYDRLAPGGVLALDVTNKEGVLANYAAGGVTVDDATVSAERREYDPETSRMETTLYVLDEAEETFRGTVTWDLRLYAPVELRDRLEDAGFEDVRVFESLDGDDLTRESTRQVVLGRKPS